MANLVLVEDNLLEEKAALDKAYAELEQRINHMIFDLSNDHPDLVSQLNAKLSLPTRRSTNTDEETLQVWRLLASKCHPDRNRTKDPVLHDLFIRAKRYREEDNRADLYFCYLELVKYLNDTSLLARLIRQSPAMQQSMQSLKQRYVNLQQSYLGQLYAIYTVDRCKASLAYRHYLSLKHAQLQETQNHES